MLAALTLPSSPHAAKKIPFKEQSQMLDTHAQLILFLLGVTNIDHVSLTTPFETEEGLSMDEVWVAGRRGNFPSPEVR